MNVEGLSPVEYDAWQVIQDAVESEAYEDMEKLENSFTSMERALRKARVRILQKNHFQAEKQTMGRMLYGFVTHTSTNVRSILYKSSESKRWTIEEVNYVAGIMNAAYIKHFKPSKIEERILVHGDHLSGVPLMSTLKKGVSYIETDVKCRDGKFLIAHDDSECKLGLTFEEIYLQPLLKATESGSKYLFADIEKPLVILVDAKAGRENKEFYEQLHLLLSSEQYKNLFCHYGPNGIYVPGPVKIVLSGSRDLEGIKGRGLNEAFIFVDGRLNDTVPYPPELLAMVSSKIPIDKVPTPYSIPVDWEKLNSMRHEWRSLCEKYKQSLEDAPLRFWGVPGEGSSRVQVLPVPTEYWKVCHELGIIINADDPGRVQRYLEELGQRKVDQRKA